MPVRIPAARRSEVLFFGAAGATALAPFYMMMPGASERVAAQTAHWAPRWERNITFFKSPVERGVQRIAPPVERTVKRTVARMPMEKVATGTHRRISNGVARAGKNLHELHL
ncbi:hypothetical protein GE09DRAFT_1227838 [Coniochaeta sp. 2T2.1]|nr:hypothetical protein GE09DRAFT_1227838 [Coniochaeta sp. 2T2.1]